MIKNRILSVLFISALTVTMFAGCGNTDTKETSNVAVDNTVTKDISSNEVEECKDYMRFLVIGEEQIPIDEEILNSEYLPDPNTGTIKPVFMLEIPDAVDVFNSNGFYIGYTKENITVGVVAQNENWTWVNSQDGGLYIKTEALKNAKVIEIASETEETETVTNTEEVILAADAKEADEAFKNSFTITELNQTMYAKQAVNTRSGPGTSYEKVGSLSTNQEVTVTGQADTGWYRIDINGAEAFVNDAYLSDTKVEVAVETPTSQETTDNEITSNDVTQETTPGTAEETPIVAPAEETSSLPDIGTATNDIKSSILSMGVWYYPDSDEYKKYPEFGLSGGMSWFEGRVATATYWDDIKGIASNYDGCECFYIEYSYTDGNDIVFRCYWG